MELVEKVTETERFLRQRWNRQPRATIVLGSGLAGYAAHIRQEETIPYQEVPHFSRSTVIGHPGQLVCGTVHGVPVVAMQGRYHLYEGYSPTEITLPVRALHALGANVLILSNASGGLDPGYRTGDIVVIDDHINLTFANPLIGPNNGQLGPRFPDMSCPYDPELSALALRIARENGHDAHRGVYAGLPGPTYETRAEYRWLRQIGADVVGMSTVSETIVAVHAGLRVLGLSVVTNVCHPDRLGTTAGAEVVATASAAEHRLSTIVSGVIRQLPP